MCIWHGVNNIRNYKYSTGTYYRIDKFWYSGSQAQTTDVGASVKSNVPIYKNVGTAYISSDDGDEEHSFTLYRQ